MLKRINFIILPIIISSLVGGVFLVKEARAADVIPTQVTQEMNNRCDVQPESYTLISEWLSKNSDGSGVLAYWDGLSGKTVNIGSLEVTSSADVNIYLNYAHMTCNPAGVGGKSNISNIKILQKGNAPDYMWNKVLSDNYNVSGNSFIQSSAIFGTFGQGAVTTVTSGAVRQVRRVRSDVVTLLGSKFVGLNGSRDIYFVAVYCVGSPSGNYSMNHDFEHSINGAVDNWGFNNCLAMQSGIGVNVNIANYQTIARSYIRKTGEAWGSASREISVTANDEIQFQHTLANNGTATADRIGIVQVRGNAAYQAGHGISGLLQNFSGSISRNNAASGQIFARATAESNPLQMNQGYMTYTTKQSDVGKRLCSDISWNSINGRRNMGPVNDAYQFEDANGNSATREACAYVAYQNELFPCVAGGGYVCGGESDVEATQQISAIPNIENRGVTKSPDNTKWKVSAWVMPEANELSGVPSQFDIANGSPCASYAAKFGVTTDVMVNQWKCKDNLQDGGSSIGNGATQTLNSQTQTIPADAKLGSRFCYAVSVSPAKLDSGESQAQQNTNMNTWRYSQPLCYKVIKKPKIQVWGNGIYAQNGIQTSTSEYNGGAVKSASWGEFEAMSGLGGSKHGIRGFKSGSSVTETKLNFGEETKGWSNLPSMKDELVANIKNRFKSGSADVYVGNITSATATAPLLNSVPRKTRVIYANDLWIRNNINQNSVDQQTIIIAKNIRIAGNVTNVDAWLVADNVVNTCAGGHFDNSNDVTITNCSQPLRINGVVMAKELKAWRVGKSDAQTPNEPSEIINQRPSMYLWAQGQAQTVTNSVKTTYTRELPVRY